MVPFGQWLLFPGPAPLLPAAPGPGMVPLASRSPHRALERARRVPRRPR